MCVFFRFRVVVGVYPYIISSIYRPAMTLASIDRRPSNRWKEGESASGAVKSCRSAHSRRDRRHTSPIKRRRSFSTSKCAGLTSRAARTERFVRTQPEEGGGKKEKHAIQWFRERARNCTHTSLLMMSFWKLFSLSTERHADLTLTNDRFLFSLLPLMSRLLCVTPLMAITAAG